MFQTNLLGRKATVIAGEYIHLEGEIVVMIMDQSELYIAILYNDSVSEPISLNDCNIQSLPTKSKTKTEKFFNRLETNNKVFIGHKDDVIRTVEITESLDTVLKRSDLTYEEYNQQRHGNMILSL